MAEDDKSQGVTPALPLPPPLPEFALKQVPLAKEDIKPRVRRVHAHFAVNNSRADDLQRVIDAGVDLNFMLYGITPLVLAITKEQERLAEMLANAEKCDVTIAEGIQSRREPIHLAAMNGYAQLVGDIVKRGANINALDALDMTPLHWAAVQGNIQTIQCLLELGAKIDCIDISGRTAFNRVAERQDLDMINLVYKYDPDINHCDIYGWSVLFHSTISCHYEVMEHLLKLGVDVNIQANSGDTALHMVFKRLQNDVLDIVRLGTDVHIHKRAVQMPTQAMLTAVNTYADATRMISLLLDYGADPNIVSNEYRDTPVGAGIHHQEWNAVELLLNNGGLVPNLCTMDPSLADNAKGILGSYCEKQIDTLCGLCKFVIRVNMKKPINANVCHLPLPSQIQDTLKILPVLQEI